MKMSRHSRVGWTPANKQILEEASAWFVDFRVGDIDARSRQHFHDWLRRSPEHIQAYLDIAMTYAEVQAPDANAELDVTALIDAARSTADINVVSISGPRSTESARSSSSTKRILAIAASLVLIVAFASWQYAHRETYTTGVGEQRSLVLADGSTVQLNSRSRIRVRYTDHERRIELLEGQALFQVAKNKQRPFVVRSGDAHVRAVGTEFDVYRKHTGTVVTVVEGRVSIDFAGSAQTPEPLATFDAPAILLTAGEQLNVGDKRVAKPQVVNPSTAIAWTQRQLIFENASLDEVAEEFNRYSARPIIVDAQALDSFHVSGTYSSSNPESLLRFLRIQPGIKLIETDREIRIARE